MSSSTGRLPGWLQQRVFFSDNADERIVPLSDKAFAFLCVREVPALDYSKEEVHLFQIDTDERAYKFASFLSACSQRSYQIFGDPHLNLCLFAVLGKGEALSTGQEFLQGLAKTAVAKPYYQPGMIAVHNPLAELEHVVRKLRDREEAIAMIGDAMNCQSYSARMVMHCRLFEAAFEKRFAGLARPLFRFLDSGTLEVSRDDIDEWLDLRHSGAHGRRAFTKYSPTNAFPHLDLVHLAACDVLLNKKNWGSADLARVNRVGDAEAQDLKKSIKLYCVDPTNSILLNEPKSSDARSQFICIDSIFSELYPNISLDDIFRLDGREIQSVASIAASDPYSANERISKGQFTFCRRGSGEPWINVMVEHSGERPR